MLENIFSISVAREHLSSPFYDYKINKRLSACQKAVTIITAIFSALLSAGLLTAPTLFLLAAHFKQTNRKAKQLALPPPLHTEPLNSTTPMRVKIAKETMLAPQASPLPVPDQLPPISKQGSFTGLPSVGNTCWLNVILKYMACAEHHDPFLNSTEEFKPALVHLRQQLKAIVSSIRKSEPVSNQKMMHVACAMHTVWPNKGIGVKQLDAITNYMELRDKFNFPADKNLSCNAADEKIKAICYQSVCEYASGSGYYKRPNKENFSPVLTVSIPYREAFERAPLNIASQFSKGGVVEVLPTLNLNEPHEEPNKNRTFLKSSALIHAPKLLEVYIRRKMEHPTVGKVKCNRLLDLDPNCRMEMVECQPVYDSANQIKKTSPHFRVTYEATAGIVHKGSEHNCGHYVLYEKTKAGTYLLHNDSQVTQISKKEALAGFKEAAFIRFEQVHRTPIEHKQDRGSL